MVDIVGNVDYDKIEEKVSKAIGNTVGGVSIVNSDILVPVELQSRWNEAITLLGSGARTTSGNGSEVDVSKYSFMRILIKVTAVSGTFNTIEGLVVYVEGLHELTGDWETFYVSKLIQSPFKEFFTISIITDPPLVYNKIRVSWDITGTSPSFTFGVYAQAKV